MDKTIFLNCLFSQQTLYKKVILSITPTRISLREIGFGGDKGRGHTCPSGDCGFFLTTTVRFSPIFHACPGKPSGFRGPCIPTSRRSVPCRRPGLDPPCSDRVVVPGCTRLPHCRHKLNIHCVSAYCRGTVCPYWKVSSFRIND